MEIIAQYSTILLIMACAFGFFMAWGVGANDVANAMGTSVGSRALTVKQAILIAMVFEFAGAYLVDRCSHVQTAVADQVHCRGRGDAGGRGGDVFADGDSLLGVRHYSFCEVLLRVPGVIERGSATKLADHSKRDSGAFFLSWLQRVL